MDDTLSPVILITGASSGIGEASARLFASRGYRVALAARRAERLQALSQEICGSGGLALAIAIPTDISRWEDIQAMVQCTLDEWGKIDVLLNNAGFGRLDWLDRLDPLDDIDAQIRVNLTGAIQTARAVLPHMIERRQGHIINMASVAGLVATPTYSVYAATKFGLRGFTDALRREVRVYGIQVSGIYPGGVESEFRQRARIRRKSGVRTPLRLRLTCPQVAEAIWGLVQRPRRSLVIPGYMRLGSWLVALLPGLADWIMEWGFVRKERDG